jgi:hypothetical protein
MLDKLLLDDKDYRVSSSFVGLGAITVLVKHRGLKVKALPVEKAALGRVFTQLESEGIRIEPGNERVEQAIRGFASAVVDRATGMSSYQ